ncbi:sulfatase-like hydrolase/transferase [Mariniflexile sp. AS56]|uniref:sulfatase-like hydrolase/transferase n=1 Tax=Mariniflexile sp. AS56 TaxID=3063957 RepID=UPI0026E9C9AD|nr:sulfatase-like hydrolase/transferase [Mariniflexile sp. AS56]MDO7173557.1 sulfatase-like hydrolase/transferase [Mariniflexile sp. AS56]
MTTRFLYSLLLLISILSCSSKQEDITNEIETPVDTNKTPNILFVIADDMGLDACPGYDIGAVKPNMPNLESMINSGIRFTNLWSNPTCAPTRATILTGKYGFRTGILTPGDVLSTSEISLQSYLDNNTNSTYNHAVIGKWHLSNSTTHPTDMGVNYYAGFSGGVIPNYYNWTLIEDGKTSTSTEYTTTKFTDLAINWVDKQAQPWFLWLAYNAPHVPFHLPPNNLHSQGQLPTDDASINANPLPYYMAALEALDSEMGRLIASMPQEERDNTIIIFIGDNGSPNQVAQTYRSSRAKGSIYQGGVNVPMVISGKNVTRINDTENALINTSDLFATIAHIAGVETTKINDSKSFKGLLTNTNNENRTVVYAENNDQTVRNSTHKYIYFNDGSEALYKLETDALETTNLLNTNQLPLSDSDSAAKSSLINELNTILN